jgi:hypothetical protein
MYKQIKTLNGDVNQKMIQRLSDSAFIPFDPQNSDYIAYLKWIEEGNVALPADENA